MGVVRICERKGHGYFPVDQPCPGCQRREEELKKFRGAIMKYLDGILWLVASLAIMWLTFYVMPFVGDNWYAPPLLMTLVSIGVSLCVIGFVKILIKVEIP